MKKTAASDHVEVIEATLGEDPITESDVEAITQQMRWPPATYWMKATAGVLAVLALASMLIAIKQIIILLLISIILAIGLQPAIAWLVSKGFRRGSAVALIFLVGATVVIGFLALITPTIIGQVGELVEKAPEYVDRAQEKYAFIRDVNERFRLKEQLQSLASDLPATALALVKSFTAFIFNALTVTILTLYFATALPKVEAGIARLLRRDKREHFQQILEDSTALVGGYILGIMMVSLIAGCISFVALAVIGVPYPAALAFWVALAAMIPTVGAMLGAAAAVLVAVFAGLPKVIATIIFFVIYQQVENYVIAPRIMKRTIQMSAAAVIVAVLIGGTLAGFPGALLALPAAAIIKVTANRLYLESRLEAVKQADAAGDDTQSFRIRLRRKHRHHE